MFSVRQRKQNAETFLKLVSDNKSREEEEAEDSQTRVTFETADGCERELLEKQQSYVEIETVQVLLPNHRGL